MYKHLKKYGYCWNHVRYSIIQDFLKVPDYSFDSILFERSLRDDLIVLTFTRSLSSSRYLLKLCTSNVLDFFGTIPRDLLALVDVVNGRLPYLNV